MKRKDEEKPVVQKQAKPKKPDIKELCAKIDDLQNQKDGLFEKLQRLGAEYENLQKRTGRQIAEEVAYEKERIIKTLLPALDNFQHTLQNADSAENVDVLVRGVQIIYDQMLDILKSHGVEQIKALGEKFDPALHQAMMQRSDADKGEDIVLEEFQTGYRLNGRVVRPSKVIVNKLPSEQRPADEPRITEDAQ